MGSNERSEKQRDDEKQRTAGIIRIASSVAACGFIMVTCARIASHDLQFAPLFAVGGALSLLTIWINLRGRARLAGILLICLLLGCVAYLMVSSEGIHDAALLTMPGILLLAALTVPRRLYIVMAALMVLIPAFIGLLEIRTTIVTPYSAHTDLLSIVDITVILLMTAAAVELMTKIVTESSSRARSSEARFRLLFNNSSEAIFVFGAIGADGVPGKIIEVR